MVKKSLNLYPALNCIYNAGLMNLNLTFYSQNTYDFTRVELTVTSLLLTIFECAAKHIINKLRDRLVMV